LYGPRDGLTVTVVGQSDIDIHQTLITSLINTVYNVLVLVSLFCLHVSDFRDHDQDRENEPYTRKNMVGIAGGRLLCKYRYYATA